MRSILDLPRLGSDPGSPFPPTSDALDSPNGLLAWDGDLQPERLLRAYRSGIFPWYSEGQPLLWWSPAPRCVLFPEKAYLSRRTRRRYNSGVYRLTADTAFVDVMQGCAEPRSYENATWITQDMLGAYDKLFRLGYAHSVEVWEGEILVGGIYGLALGEVFFGESMFSRRTDASKIALVALCRHLNRRGFGLLDCQVGNPHLYRMGCEEISRGRFELLLRQLIERPQAAENWTGAAAFGERW
jgi:leucyl/phenylalanyl-tRNA--protein transferase